MHAHNTYAVMIEHFISGSQPARYGRFLDGSHGNQCSWPAGTIKCSVSRPWRWKLMTTQQTLLTHTFIGTLPVGFFFCACTNQPPWCTMDGHGDWLVLLIIAFRKHTCRAAGMHAWCFYQDMYPETAGLTWGAPATLKSVPSASCSRWAFVDVRVRRGNVRNVTETPAPARAALHSLGWIPQAMPTNGFQANKPSQVSLLNYVVILNFGKPVRKPVCVLRSKILKQKTAFKFINLQIAAELSGSAKTCQGSMRLLVSMYDWDTWRHTHVVYTMYTLTDIRRWDS